MFVFDLDGCISNDHWRRHLLGTGPVTNWDAYHERCGEDGPAFTRMYRGRSDIIIITGRPKAYVLQTHAWLSNKAGVLDFLLFMREEGDKRPAPEVKHNVMAQLLEDGHAIDAAYDDREDIIKVYKDMGIINAHVLRCQEKS